MVFCLFVCFLNWQNKESQIFTIGQLRLCDLGIRKEEPGRAVKRTQSLQYRPHQRGAGKRQEGEDAGEARIRKVGPCHSKPSFSY